MNFSIPAAGIQSAGAAFETAANGLAQAFTNPYNPLTAGSTIGDSVDLSGQVAALAKSSLDFAANVKMEIVENEMRQSTFSMLA
jgi:hypothetical protein